MGHAVICALAGDLPPSMRVQLPLSLQRPFTPMGSHMSDTGLQKLAFFVLILLILFVAVAGGV